MKKIVLTLSIICAFSGLAYADGNAFTPLNFNDTSYGNSNTQSAVNTIPENEAIGNGNIQNAIQQLENAQKNFMNLKDSNRNKAKRKNFKFISFNKLDKNYQKTVKNSLIGIPNQMIEYFSLKNINPEDI